MNSWISLSIAVLLWLGVVTQAHAAPSVASLGVRSFDGEDELERRLSHGLRTTAASLNEYTVGDRIVSLEQMSLAHSCDEPDATCLGQIAQTLAADLLLFGSVVSTKSTHELTLNVFDARQSKVRTTVLSSLTAEQLAPAALGETLSPTLRKLMAPPDTGKVRVHANRPELEVTVDGNVRGKLDAAGQLELELPAGQHALQVVDHTTSGPALSSEQHTIHVTAGETRQLDLTLASPSLAEPVPTVSIAAPNSPHSSRKLRRVLGWTGVGVGIAFAAATLYSWIRIGRINDNADYNAYRAKFPRGDAAGGVPDVCKAARQGVLAMREPASAELEHTSKKLCAEASSLETLQYVFLGGTVVGSGVGTYLLLTSRDTAEKRLSLQPRFSASTALLEASLRF